ncbi:MAG: zinc finger Ran-binding domain-containing protein, partial [Firmicutes bacterium]|nr:zinc finger Ran-binding domain-containing protein [Bacillota bacterium]
IYPYYEEHFNWALTIAVWISAVIPAAILYAVYSHLENQEIQINLLNVISRNQMTDDYNLAGTGTSTSSNTQAPIKPANTWTCPKCRTINPNTLNRCTACDHKKMI